MDCYVRKNPDENAKVYVVHQLTVDGSKYDEDKVMLGYSSKSEAVKAFKKFTFKPSVMFGGVTEFTLDHFKVVAYQASNSYAMLTTEETYNEFKERGLITKGIKSPVQVAQIVSEELAMDLNKLVEELSRDPVVEIFKELQEDGVSRKDIFTEAYMRYTKNLSENTHVSFNEFLNDYKHLFETETLEETFMDEPSDEFLDKDYIPYSPFISYETTEQMIEAFKFAKQNMINCRAYPSFDVVNDDGNLNRYDNTIVFYDENEADKFVALIKENNIPEYAGQMLDDYFSEAPSCECQSDEPYDNLVFVVIIKAQPLINRGTEKNPIIIPGSDKIYEVQSNLSFKEATSLVESLKSSPKIDIIPSGEVISSIEMVESTVYKTVIKESKNMTVITESISDVENIKRKAGIIPEKNVTVDSSSVHETRKMLANLEKKYSKVDEASCSSVSISGSELEKVVKITENTLLKNIKQPLERIAEAVSLKLYGNTSYKSLIAETVRNQPATFEKIVFLENKPAVVDDLERLVSNGIIKYRNVSESHIQLSGSQNAVEKVVKYLTGR